MLQGKNKWLNEKESEKIKKIITQRYGSQNEAAIKCKLQLSNFTRIINGNQEPGARTWVNICRVLGVAAETITPKIPART